jgi:hypothetical protein
MMIDDLHEKLEMKYREPPWRLGECIARPIEKLDTAQFNRKKVVHVLWARGARYPVPIAC